VKLRLEVQSEALNEFYLGIPTSVGRSPVATFKFLYDKIWKYVNSMSGHPLSRAGNETWLKTVIQAIPNFVMSCFELTIATCEEIRKLIANIWWGIEEGRKKMNWRSWDWLSTPKVLGGMGFPDLPLFNQAMLAKQGWRLLTDPSSLCARVLKGRYYPDTDFWSATKPRPASYTWPSILHGRELLYQGVCWGIGNGRMVKILRDNWIPNFPLELLNPISPIPTTAKVHCLIKNVFTFFEPDAADAIMQIYISRHADEDFACWPFTRHGTFSVRSAYNLSRSSKFFRGLSRSNRGLPSNWLLLRSTGRLCGR
jgi:hypothetical protein